MRRPLALAALVSISATCASPAFAIDMPARKPGLWELKMEFGGRKLPAQVMKQCTDAASDKVMNSNFGGAAHSSCSKQEVTKTANGMVIDSVCTFGDSTTTSHAVVTGSFDSAYTVTMNSTREGGHPIPGMPATGASNMTIQAKWIGPCGAGQRPGDVTMGNGMTMNVLDISSRAPRE